MTKRTPHRVTISQIDNRTEDTKIERGILVTTLRHILAQRYEPVHFMEAALDDAQALLNLIDKDKA